MASNTIARMKRILVVEDHHLVRTAVQMLLSQWFAPVIVDTADNLGDADQLLHAQPDCNLVVLDLDLPDAKGTEAISALRSRHPMVPIVVFSAHDQNSFSSQCLRLGAAAHLSKSCYPKELVDAVRKHARPDAITVPRLTPTHPNIAPIRPMAQAGASERLTPARRDNVWFGGAVNAGLTERQAEVLKALCDGLSNREIAAQLKLREPTVKVHLSQIYKVLRVKNRFEALLVAQRFHGRASGEAAQL